MHVFLDNSSSVVAIADEEWLSRELHFAAAIKADQL
jgi:hypothetical protein